MDIKIDQTEMHISHIGQGFYKRNDRVIYYGSGLDQKMETLEE